MCKERMQCGNNKMAVLYFFGVDSTLIDAMKTAKHGNASPRNT